MGRFDPAGASAGGGCSTNQEPIEPMTLPIQQNRMPRTSGIPGSVVLALMGALALMAGCGTNIGGSGVVTLDCNGNGVPDGIEADCNQNGIPDSCDIESGFSLDVSPADEVPDECVTSEPNDTFEQASKVTFDQVGFSRFDGVVSSFGELDVYLLGALSSGEQIVIDVNTTGSLLDVSVAVFDDQERLVFANDDRGGTSSRFLDSFVDLTVRHGGSSYYLVVTSSAFAPFGRETGSYFIDVQVTAGGVAPPPQGQILFLDFDGAVVDSPALESPGILDPFDAGDISRVYAGQTEMMKELIRSVMEQNFERFEIAIVTTDDPPLPSDIEVSVIFFGGFNPSAFGISEQVDLYNLDFCDDAVIFTDSFTPQLFFGTPPAAELAVAIGNVASHEAGHLLGLNHVSDDRALMDDQSAADILLDDQEFMEGPLSVDIMPIGTQDAVLLLFETVGPRIDVTSTFAADKRRGVAASLAYP